MPSPVQFSQFRSTLPPADYSYNGASAGIAGTQQSGSVTQNSAIDRANAPDFDAFGGGFGRGGAPVFLMMQLILTLLTTLFQQGGPGTHPPIAVGLPLPDGQFPPISVGLPLPDGQFPPIAVGLPLPDGQFPPIAVGLPLPDGQFPPIEVGLPLPDRQFPPIAVGLVVGPSDQQFNANI